MIPDPERRNRLSGPRLMAVQGRPGVCGASVIAPRRISCLSSDAERHDSDDHDEADDRPQSVRVDGPGQEYGLNGEGDGEPGGGHEVDNAPPGRAFRGLRARTLG